MDQLQGQAFSLVLRALKARVCKVWQKVCNYIGQGGMDTKNENP